MDYGALGFKCGVEIHQRLDTHKLFCNCYSNPSEKRSNAENDFVIRRRIRPAAGELGKVDEAARFEAAKGRETVYFVPEDEACLVECDDEPPHAPNQEALIEACRIAKALKMKPVHEVEFMRKTVADGSAVSGFQRTALLATDGELEGVGIQTLCLEEESAGIVDGGYRLDRLGIPLVEIATAPEIRDGEHCRKICESLGRMLRSNAKVQRGLGSIRQDINVSIAKGARVEIKGVQELKTIPELVENEVLRQQSLATPREETRRTVGTKTEFMRPLPGKARMYPETDVLPVLLARYWEDAGKPKSFESAVKGLEARGLNPQLAEKMARSPQKLFLTLTEEMRVDATVAATTLLETKKELERKGVKPSDECIKFVLGAFKKGKLVKSAIPVALEKGCTNEDCLKKNDLTVLSGAELARAANEFSGAGPKAFGLAMKKYRLRADPKQLKAAFEKELHG